MHGRPSTEVVRLVAPTPDAVAEAASIEAHEARDMKGLAALPGARRLMKETPSDRLAIVTPGTWPLATARLRAVRLPTPLVLVTAERVKRGKPHPEGYLLAARELGAAPAECVVLEDAPLASRRAERPACMSLLSSVRMTARHRPRPTSLSATCWSGSTRRTVDDHPLEGVDGRCPHRLIARFPAEHADLGLRRLQDRGSLGLRSVRPGEDEQHQQPVRRQRQQHHARGRRSVLPWSAV
jgi:HAD superfamily hydrolase (TIGR01509 family)